MASEKKFSKAAWLKYAKADLAAGIITQQDIDNACKTWVDEIDGKTKEEIEKDNMLPFRDEWYI